MYWDIIVYVIMNVSDKRWKGEGASHPGWTPQAHYAQTIADTGPCCIPDNRFHHFWLFAIKSLYATASMNDGEVVLNPCICYAEVIHSSSRIRFKWHRCETQNMNTGELGATPNKAKFFLVVCDDGSNGANEGNGSSSLQIHMEGADLKRLYEWYSHEVTIPNSSLSCIVFGFFAGSSTSNSFLQTFLVVEFVHLYTFECNPAVQQWWRWQ